MTVSKDGQGQRFIIPSVTNIINKNQYYMSNINAEHSAGDATVCFDLFYLC
jgi:hypothetical protein